MGIVPRVSPVEYEQVIGAIREVVHRVVPLNATVLVASKGDEELVRLGPRRALHFPHEDDGRYAGYHPSDSDAAIAMIEEERRLGADYFLLPSTGFWWLEYYEGLRRYLEQQYEVVESGDSCWIVQLAQPISVEPEALPTPASTPPEVTHPMRELIEALLPSSARVVFLRVDGRGAALDGYQSWLMPREPAAAFASLERLEESGVEFLVISQSEFEWLEDNPEIATRLRRRHTFVTRQERLCEIYELQREADKPSAPSVTPNHKTGASKRSLGALLRRILPKASGNGKRS